MPTKKQPRGRPTKAPTFMVFARLGKKENALLEKEVKKTGIPKSVIIRNAIKQHYGITEEP